MENTKNTEYTKILNLIQNLIELKCSIFIDHNGFDNSYIMLYNEYEIIIREESVVINLCRFKSGIEIKKMVEKYYKKSETKLLDDLEISITKDLRKNKLEKIRNDD